MQSPRALPFIAAAAILAAAVAAPSTAAGPNDQLACALVSHTKLRQIFGLPKVKQALAVTSPTATEPAYQHTVDGSDESDCALTLFRTSLSPAVLKKLAASPGKISVPPGVGAVSITTNVRDPDQGNPWNADDFFGTAFSSANYLVKQFGGGALSLPSFGASVDHEVWIGNKNHALGMWETKDSVIRINVVAGNGAAPAKLLAVAKLAVPTFAGLVP